MKPLVLKAFGLVCGLAVCGAGARAAVELQTLVDRSPFAPAGQVGGGAAEEQPGTLEFRGMVTDSAGTSYSIFDATAQKAKWVRADDATGALRVRSFDAASNTLEVEQNGRPVKLTMKRATILAGQSVAAMVPAAKPAQAAGTPGNPAAPGQVTGGADAKRLEAVAAEVRRRRALRNAARPQTNPPAQAPAPGAAPATQ